MKKNFKAVVRKALVSKYTDQIMEAVELSIEEEPPDAKWKEKHGEKCLSQVVESIVRKIMRGRES